MKVWRVSRAKYAKTGPQAYDGRGAALAGGRWNSPAVRMGYGSTSPALASLEYLTNYTDRANVPDDLVIVEAEVPDDAFDDVRARLPTDWLQVPPPPSCAALGDAWIAARTSLGLIVPSVILLPPEATPDRNVLINPLHPLASAIRYQKPEPIRLDDRLF